MTQSNLSVAIIMDGNGRWAQRMGLSRMAGHRAGAETLRRVVEAAPGCGIGTLTAYAFSADNWKRPLAEVNALMALLAWYLDAEVPRLRADGVKLSVIGRRDRLPAMLVSAIERAERATAAGRRIWLRLAIDYSARESIVRAAEHASRDRLRELLDAAPPVDLLIRTGGEQRLSDFLLWESAYAELVFVPTMWPDFGAADLRRAVQEFHRRERRFGGVPVSAPLGGAVAERWLR